MPLPSKVILRQGLMLNQIRESSFSKQGQTTTTGVFEGQPQNGVIGRRNYTVPRSNAEKIKPPIDVVFSRRNNSTYLDSLKASGRL
jgi:hypothetical protein